VSARRTSLLVGLILLATAIRWLGLGAQSLWFDEGIAWHVATQPTLGEALTADPTNPPAYFLTLFAAARLFGETEFALRWLSAACGVLLVPLVYRLGRRLFSPRAGMWAAALTAVSPPLWWAAQEARMYAFMALLAVIAALAWHQLHRRPTRAAWIALWTSELLLLYSHSTGPIYAVWLNAATAIAWLSGAVRARGGAARPDWRTWLAGQAAVVLLWSPWLIGRFILLPAENRTVASPPAFGFDLLAQLWQWMWSGSWTMIGQEPALAALAAVVFALAVLLIPWKHPDARWLVLHAVILAAGMVAGAAVVGINVHGRYLAPAIPLLLTALGAGLARWGRAPGARPVLSAALAAPFLLASAAGILLPALNPAYQHDDARGLVSRYANTLSAADSVLAWSYVDRYDLAYYWPRLGVAARRVTLPETGDLDAVAPLLPASGRVSASYWFAQRGDYRRMLACLLGHGGASPPAVFETFGLGDASYPAAPQALPQSRAFDGAFRPGRIIAAGALPDWTAERAACVPVSLTLTSPTTRPLKLALIVKNALGWEIARSDAVFARADQKTSDQAAPGETLAAFPLLRLPYGAPAGRYAVTARLYDDANLSGHDALASGGAPIGKDLAFGEWEAQPGADWSRAARPAEPLAPVTLAVSPSLLLLAHDAAAVEVPIHNGSRIRVTLLWEGQGALPPLVLADSLGRWRVEAPPAAQAGGWVTRDWREIKAPAEAEDGTAELSLPSGQVLARYALTALPGAFVEPAFATRAEADLPGIGRLVGYTLASAQVARGATISITLVWRAGAQPPDASYTVFVQALDASGRLIAQSDAVPAAGARPTTGWRPGEYIADPHQLRFNADAGAGAARLIVGMYDAATGRRLAFADGSDAASLPAALEVR
jgi:4-amino-4-deoxy-L-arabinose transferase-like glycosyltransferase